MCGIIGCIGSNTNLISKVIEGLECLEYRGYDSSGIAFIKNHQIQAVKAVGRISDLKQKLNFEIDSSLVIGHTRWATHGKVSLENCHPHFSKENRIALVHNGVIENFKNLRIELQAQGYDFYSETDSEVIANLIDYYSQKYDHLKAVELGCSRLEGSYALAIIFKDDDRLYFAKKDAPLILGKSENFNFIVSDIVAASSFSNEIIAIDDHQYGYLSQDKIAIYQNGKSISKQFVKCKIQNDQRSKGLFDHYMEKEIQEQPSVIRRLINHYVKDDKFSFGPYFLKKLRGANRIYIVACGTSYHAGLVGKYYFETLAKKETEVCIASEFSYHLPLVSERPFFLLISQSGETADLRKALKKIQELKAPVYTMTNVVTSSLAQQADGYLDLMAGPEIAVASTKAYTAQVTLLALLAHALNDDSQTIKEKFQSVIATEEKILSKPNIFKDIVTQKIAFSRSCFYIGRNLDYLLAQEAALKMKEISYIQTEGFAGGELKHGTIALIEKGVPVIALISQDHIEEATRVNIEEVKSRGATVITIARQSVAKKEDDIIIPEHDPLLSPLVFAIVVQYFAYYAALINKRDIDKPRNLAKSVTVE